MHLLKLLARHDQNSTDKSLVMIKWVELWGGDMEWTHGRELVNKMIIEGQKVNVMHDHKITLIFAQEETDVQERGPIESKNRMLQVQ